MQVGYPFRVDGRGRTADASDELHIRQMIEQVIFTIPGERVNRPDFGSGVQQLIFAPNREELAAATQFLITGALEQWLGELMVVEGVEVESEESRLTITIQYIVKRTQQRQVVELSQNV
ncbi:MAG TPA: GPW/gp25 family protein [Synechococcales cyanobacterium M55_K2018_004]|nr:GPW/gp25 family protein [Synechococcales cyanobacterium M55_K2018_004]